MRKDGSSPSRSRQNAIIALVVVLPCAPATTIERCSETSSASSSARGRPATRPANAVETYTSHPAGGDGGSGEIVTSIPSRCARYGVSTRSQPATSAPHACATSAYALMPAPPMPAIQMRLPVSGCELDELIGDPLGCIGPCGCAHGCRHRLEPRPVGEQRLDQLRHAASLRLRNDDGAPRALEPFRVLALVAAGGELAGNENGRKPRGRKLPDRSSGARDGDVG